MEEKDKVIAYKGFEKDLTCRGFQYEIGKEYECNGEINVCINGFHACENPFDVLKYYEDIFCHRYCEVEQSGKIVKDREKQASSVIKIKAEIGLDGLLKAGIEWLKNTTDPENFKIAGDKLNDNSEFCAKISSSVDNAQISSSGNNVKIICSGDHVKISSIGIETHIGSCGDYAQIGSSEYSAKIGSCGDDAQIGSSGDYAEISSSGDHAHIDSNGNYAKIFSTGKNSIICCTGYNSVATAKIGSWITLTEWGFDQGENPWLVKNVKTEYVDGERIREDTWYMLVNGEFKEVNP